MAESKAASKPAAEKIGDAKSGKSVSNPSVTRVIVEGEPVDQGEFNMPDLGQKEDESSPQPKVKDIVKLANEKLDAAAGDAGFSPDGAKAVLAATDVEPLWVPDHEKLSVYANPIAKQTHDTNNKGDK